MLELEKLLLSLFDRDPSSIGAMIIRHDGTILLSFFPDGTDVESVAANAFQAFKDLDLTVDQMNPGNLQQAISETSQGHLVCANFGGGLLVTLNSNFHSRGLNA